MSRTTASSDVASPLHADASSSEFVPRRWLETLARAGGHWPNIAIGCALLSTLVLLAQAWSIARLAQGVAIERESLMTLWPAIAVLAASLSLRGALGGLRSYAGTRASQQIRRRLRERLLQRFAELGPLWVHRQHRASLANRVWDQVESLHGYYADFRPQTRLAGLIPLLLLAVVFPLNWAAGLILAITAPLVPIFMILVGIAARKRSREQFQEMDRMGRHFMDLLTGLKTLKLFGSARRGAQVEAVSHAFRKRTMRVLRLAFLSSTVLEFFTAVSIALLAVYLGFHFLGHLQFGTWDEAPLTLQTALFILVLAPEFYQPLRELGVHYHAKAEAEAAALDLAPIVGATPFTPPALGPLSLQIAAGERIAITGSSGAGKSTLLNLLLGFVEVADGMLSLNGHPLTQGLPAGTATWVGQETVVLSGTLADNLRLAKPQASDDELEAALAKADLSTWHASLPHGLATPLGEGGQPLSGGQARRLSLARAFLHDAPLVLLDEPTASLDAESEARVIRALQRLGEGRTLLLLTHRPELLPLCQRLIRLEGGRLVEDRGHHRLAN
ncbi:ABC transporter transmembrane domain-containing protein [Cobetia sp. ICG0124]|uniref:ABC transporter ATP-binding protein/permease n=1 Tax=Cobetia sp. ICG0124 TaxID=2053669 RepID=UPI000FD8330A|nr:ABC transporter transmembrane domain-containing protein [Cobetia sp. ICG0124]AZV32120.1 thiol reductant ABC exporter subunit CydD [Cobetia sp. ICG0124]